MVVTSGKEEKMFVVGGEKKSWKETSTLSGPNLKSSTLAISLTAKPYLCGLVSF